MGTYTTVDNAFWTDANVIDNYSPEDKYFYLYLLTNIHANMSGCFEISRKQIAQEMGYSEDSVGTLFDRFINSYHVIDYDRDTKEILIYNWAKYHWTTSDKYLIALRKKINAVKSKRFSAFLNAQLSTFVDAHGSDFIGYRYGIDTTGIDTTVTVTVTDNISIVDNKGNEEKKVKKEKKSVSEGEESEVEVIDSVLATHSLGLIQAVENWLEYKKEKRQSYQPRGKSTLLKTIDRKAKEFGDKAVIEAIEETMANGYQGIVWDYLKKYGRGSSKSFEDVDLGDLI